MLFARIQGRDSFAREDKERGKDLALHLAAIDEAIEILLRRNQQSAFVEASLDSDDRFRVSNVLHQDDDALGKINLGKRRLFVERLEALQEGGE